MKTTTIRLALCLFALSMPLFFPACELLFDKPDGDLMKDVETEVDYSRASHVNARVAIMPGTVGMVTMDISDRKIGYPFDVQATANPGYGFVGWVALTKADWDAKPATKPEDHIREKAAGSSLLASITNAVNIDGALTGMASVTVKTGEAIVLVPFCVERPSISSSNPSMDEMDVSYTREVAIRFKNPVEVNSFKWLEGEVPPAGTKFKNMYITGKLNGGEGDAIEGIENKFGDPELDDQGKKLTIQLRSGETLEAQSQITITLSNNIRLRGYPEVSFAAGESISYTVKTPQYVVPRVKSGTIKGSRNSDFDPSFDADTPANDNSRNVGVANPVYIEFKYEGHNGTELPDDHVNGVLVVEKYEGSSGDSANEVESFVIDTSTKTVNCVYIPRKTTTGPVRLFIIPGNSEGTVDTETTISRGIYLEINLVERPKPIAAYTAEYTGGNFFLTTKNGTDMVDNVTVEYTSRTFDEANGKFRTEPPGPAVSGTPDTSDNGVSNWNLPASPASWVLKPDASGYTATGTLTEYTFTVKTVAADIESEAVTFTLWNIDGMKVSNTIKSHTILTFAELKTMADNINNGVNTQDVYVLIKDITLSTTAWTPIGTASSFVAVDDVTTTNPATTTAFRGKFYGTGHTISGLVLTGGNASYNGFFGFTDNALIEDLSIEYRGNPLTVNRNNYTGIAVGLARNTILRDVNVRVEGGKELEVTSSASNAYIGGITGGMANFNAGNEDIKNSASSAKLKISTTSETIYAGGAAGYVKGTAINGLTITGGLELTKETLSAYHAGGAVGRGTYSSTASLPKNLALKNVTASGVILVTSPDSTTTSGAPRGYAGGIIGSAEGNNAALSLLEDCRYTGGKIEVKGESEETRYVGGLAGYIRFAEIRDSGAGGTDPLVINAENSVAAGSENSSSIVYAYAGGLAGYIVNSTVSDCTTGGTGRLEVSAGMSYASNYSDASTGSATAYAGGFAGSISGITISGSSTGGTGGLVVNAGFGSSSSPNTSGNGSGSAYAGGFAGNISGSGNTISSSKAGETGNLEVNARKSSSSSSSGTVYAGGFAGIISGTVSDSSAGGTGTLELSAVITSSSPSSPIYAGGFVGSISSSATVSNSHAGKTSALVVRAEHGGTGDIYAGGFAGNIAGGDTTDPITTTIRSCSAGLYANSFLSAKRLNASSAGVIYAGGFAGRSVGANLEKTAAGTNLVTSSDGPGVVNGKGNTWAGGLVGMAYNGTIKESYAKGKVWAKNSANDYTVYCAAGGIVGVIGNPGSSTRGLTIEDSYSISPSVKSKNEGYIAYSGGIAGYLYSYGYARTIQRSYYGGNEIAAEGTSPSTAYPVCAAGIAGNLYLSTSTTIRNNAIVSPNLSISAGGTAVTKIARNIHTYGNSSQYLTVNNNYHPGTITLDPPPGATNTNNMNGASAALNNLAAFTDPGTLGWSSAVWQWDSVKGRPVLINNPEQ